MLPVAAHAATYTVSASAPRATKMPASFAQGLYDSDAFYPGSKQPLKIHVGDSVRFVGGFHTATLVGKASPASLGLIQPAAGQVYAPLNDAAGAPFYFGGLPKFAYNVPTLSPSGPTVVTNKTTTQSSGALFLSQKGYKLKFAKAGKYTIVCLIHPFMRATIDVKGAKAPVPTPAAAAKQGVDEANADVQDAIAEHLAQAPAVQDPKTAVVHVGAGTKRYSLFAFYPQALSVKAGTTITFTLGGPNEIHNVGFGDFTIQSQFIQATDLFPQGPTSPNQVAPQFVYGTDPAVNGVYTYTGATMHGNGLFATPIMDGSSASPQGQQVKVTVPAAGTYTLICQIHPNMVALLHVHA
jgi:plastocyanin